MEIKGDERKNTSNIDRIDDASTSALFELVTGVVAWALIGELVILCVFNFSGTEKILVSMCWWMGVAVAIFWAVHIRSGLMRALGMSMGDAQGLLRFHAIIRYIIAAAGMAVVYFGTVLFAGEERLIFATAYVPGILTLKAGAYTQPLIHGIFERLHRSGTYTKDL